MRWQILVSGAALVCLTAAQPTSRIEYRFDDVHRKVIVTSGGVERAIARGASATGGDLVRTGWFSSATVVAPEARARFDLYASTEVQLASEIPGVLIMVQRGRLKAFFDKLAGNEPRLVATPGVLLAVRGTRYGVEVDSSGRGTLAVFEGVVEVISRKAPQPTLLIHAGELCEFSSDRSPRKSVMPPGMTEGGWDRSGAHGPSSMPGDRQAGGDMHGGQGPSGGRGVPPTGTASPGMGGRHP